MVIQFKFWTALIHKYIHINYLRSLLLFVFLLPGVLNDQGYAGGSYPGNPQKPRLVVRIVVEQMRHEMLLRYWDNFSEDGFKKLVNEGVLCENARIKYSNVASSTGFATISTGAYPSMHGIISNNWYNRLSGSMMNCINNDQYLSLGGIDLFSRYSPDHLLTSTTGDELKMMNLKSKVFSVGLNPVSAVMGSGKLSTGAYWFDDSTANWMTNTHYMDSLPKWVQDFNDRNLENIYMEREWETLLPDSIYVSHRNEPNETGTGFPGLKRKRFPYRLQEIKALTGDFGYLKFTPFGNTYTNDFAVSLIMNEQLGQDSHTDLLNVAFSASGYVNELFGTRSIEMEDLFLRLDQQISHLLSFLESRFDKKNLLVVLTSDRGSADPYEFRKEKGLPASRFKPKEGLALLDAYLNVLYGRDEWVTAYAGKQIYLDHTKIDLKGHNVDDFQEKISRFMVKKSGVAYAVKATSLQNHHFSDGMHKMMQNSYHPKRSGDILLVFEPGSVEEPRRVGSIYNYDTHIPMIWWGNNLPQGIVDEEVSLRDIAATISHRLNIPMPDASSGRSLIPLVENND